MHDSIACINTCTVCRWWCATQPQSDGCNSLTTRTVVYHGIKWDPLSYARLILTKGQEPFGAGDSASREEEIQSYRAVLESALVKDVANGLVYVYCNPCTTITSMIKPAAGCNSGRDDGGEVVASHEQLWQILSMNLEDSDAIREQIRNSVSKLTN
jgi:hypothetical protein